MLMNNITPKMKERLAPTDSRLRPDQRALENGDLDLADKMKGFVENKQRDKRKWREKNPGNEFVPRYFEKIYDEDSKSEYYAYGTKRDYF